ncbi:stage II sporulation protein M [Natronolimnobius sp. AArcel1]|uniref:stage II sporulation protein M n=1 Tax=Natronolimnobius sp. AArcel1 TaxID=1679093 RepID=UPI0013EA3898|nr:stage II sporulation protein M [Natronolimnobius sp. AArcel1]NGM68825.1 stage II sporulation protein M [Natronolimnobius sp. AArcel1]
MNGAGNGDDTDANGTNGRGGSAESGGFEFGPDQQSPNDTGRIRVDLDNGEETASGGPPGDDPDTPPADPEPDPGSNAVRNWTAMCTGLALVSLATAIFIFVTGEGNSALEPALGSAALAVVFGALAVLPKTGNDMLIRRLSSGWVENRRAVWFATGLFAFGTLIGVALLAAGFDLLEMVAELLEEELLPELEDEAGEFELTATFFIVNNTQAFLMAIAGALTVGLLTAFVMIFNGVIVGNVGASAANEIGIDFIIVGLLPHGIFELPAIFIAAGVGFQIVYRFGQRVIGSRERFFTKSYVARTIAFVLFAWLLLVLAAFVEAYVTPALLEALFGAQFEAEGGALP